MDLSNVKDITIQGKSVKQIEDSDGNVLWQKEQPIILDYLYIENTYDGENTVTVKKSGTPTATDLQYSLNGTDWTDIDLTQSSTDITLSALGDKVYFRGDNASGFSNNSSIYIKFTANQNNNVGGNISSLLNRDCEDVLTIPNNYCFNHLFYGNNKLIDASGLVLPATTLANYCYYYMFAACTSLTTVPELPATTLANNCYYNMFSSCTSLTTAPELSANTLASGCYSYMFEDCTSLTTATELPATTLESSCYSHMFSGCSSLTTAPALPATTLASNCYYSMFNGCSSLTTAPELPATTLVSDCYYCMFYNCTNINYIKVGATSWNTSYAFYWVSGVSATGDFYNLGGATIPTGTNGIPSGWTEIKPQPVVKNYLYIENAYNGENTVILGNYTADGIVGIDLQYSLDGTNWTDVEFVPDEETSVPIANMGDKLYLRGDNPNGWVDTCYFYIAASESHNVGGNISSLFNRNCDDVMELPNESLSSLFEDDETLVDASNLILPATTLAESCYQGMFANCSSLTTAPELPATTLAYGCYSSMFWNCTSLTTAPELPATTLADFCYHSMFQKCSSLTTAPELPATTLAEWCYGSMFSGCTSLNYIKVKATSWNTSYATDWVSGVSATGDFYNLGNADIPTGTNGIPSGWTEHTTE